MPTVPKCKLITWIKLPGKGNLGKVIFKNIIDRDDKF